MIKKRKTLKFTYGSLLLMLSLFLFSCMKFEPLELKENPIIVPASSTIHKVGIKNIEEIGPIADDDPLENNPFPHGPIKNEWVSCYLYGEVLTLYLARNTSTESRSFEIMGYAPDTGGKITITQLGMTK